MTESNKALAESPNPAEEKRDLLAGLLPEAFSEGQLDVAALKRALGEDTVIEGGERYALTWAGKGDAYKVLQTPTTATIRPQRDLSINFDQAQHIFIEGENLEVLKVLQKAYFGKVKLIYIDPPYNTGSDAFIYPDRFQESKEEYLKRINDLADDGTLMREGFFRKNSRESGHFHSNWLSMMLPRLYIARNLLRDDGVILISCDDNEIHNLRNLMHEIMGEENSLAVLVWDRNRKNDARFFSVGHEYMLAYAKSKSTLVEMDIRLRAPKEGVEEIRELFQQLRVEHKDDWEKIRKALKKFFDELPDDDPRKPLGRYNKVDEKGPYRDDGNINWPGGGGPTYDVYHPVTKKLCKKPKSGWRYPTIERFNEEVAKGNIVFGENENKVPSVRTNLFDKTEQVLQSVHYSYAQTATNEFAELFGGVRVFDNPKNYKDIKLLVDYICDVDALVMDFFAGSAPTVHAVMELNATDGGKRQSISVQLPERIDDTTEVGRNALSLGFTTVADIGRDRCRRAVEKLSTNTGGLTKDSANLGFKSFVLSPSNFKLWRGDGVDTADQLAEQIRMFVKSEKDDAEVEDILFELLLKFGQGLIEKVETLKLAEVQVFAIHKRKMLFVLDGFKEEMIEPLLTLKPREIIALDSVFLDSDELKSNLDLHCRDAGIKFTCI